MSQYHPGFTASELAAERRQLLVKFCALPQDGDVFAWQLEVVLDGVATLDQLVFTSELAEMCLWTPISVDAMRGAIVDQARSTLAQFKDLEDKDLNTLRAAGHVVRYVTLYKGRAVLEQS